jgi:hypothetical protein
MQAVLRIIADYQWWIYGFFGLLLLFYLRRALVARREGVRSLFKLEQEQARARYGRSVAVSAVILLAMIGIFAVSNPLLPIPMTTPEPSTIPTNGPLAASTLTPTPLPPTITPTPTATPIPPTRPVRPTATPEVSATDAPAVKPAACPSANVCITSPGMNQVVQGNVAVRGIANVDNFQYYKIEAAPGANPKDGQWTVVGQLHYNPVSGGVLETFNSGAYPAGTYTLRLVVVDRTGNYPEPCRVTIVVQR